MKKEPTWIVMLILWVLQMLIRYLGMDVPVDTLEVVASFIAMLIAAVGLRTQVFSKNTITEAQTLGELKKAA